MCTSWNFTQFINTIKYIITYWEMCTSWNIRPVGMYLRRIITYWEMCTSWNNTTPRSLRSKSEASTLISIIDLSLFLAYYDSKQFNCGVCDGALRAGA